MLALDTESPLEPLPQADTEPEYSQWKSYQEADSLMKGIWKMAREENELLEINLDCDHVDEDEDEYGMTSKAEEEFYGFVAEAEKSTINILGKPVTGNSLK